MTGMPHHPASGAEALLTARAHLGYLRHHQDLIAQAIERAADSGDLDANAIASLRWSHRVLAGAADDLDSDLRGVQAPVRRAAMLQAAE